uniref:ATR interacting protein n=1 Tax=Sphenodon punctatus TaxID=8508 RepID=A0A8D0G9M6_SPHPU
MSVNPLFGNKKRNSSILYGVAQTKVTASSSSLQGATSGGGVGNSGDGFPPNKRYKSLDVIKCKETEDPFGDNDDFTADDLEEIDIIATQALTQDVDSNAPSKINVLKSEQNARPSSLLNSTNQKLANAKQRNITFSAEKTPKDQFGIHAIMRFLWNLQLKELQDEMLIKNGEIKILRDSMQQMESTMEEQRKSYILLEKERAQTLSEKEKDFSRKLQSLQSELQFKDAEMNELRTKLQKCERIKPAIPTSPKKSPSGIVKSERCFPWNGKKGFPTKESFSSETSPQLAYSKAHLLAQTSVVKEGKTLFLVYKNAGSILLNALMKQPIANGSSLGLCHLLSSNSESLPVSVLQPSSLNMYVFNWSASPDSHIEISLKEAQKLAVTGLNLIAVDEGATEDNLAESERRLFHIKRFKIPGAVHLLPLIEYHVGEYCQAVQSMVKFGNSPGNQSVLSAGTNSSIASSVEDFFSTVEETAITSLGVLYYLVFYSWDASYTLLSSNVKTGLTVEGTRVLEMDKNVMYSNQCSEKNEKSKPQKPNAEHQDAPNDEPSHHPLFKKLLQILTLSSTATGYQIHNIMNQSLKVLVKLAENSTTDFLLSFQYLLRSQVLLRFVCLEMPLPAVHLTVRLLAMLIDHQALAAQLCSHSETCLLLALYLYITSRPDKSASEMLWLQLEQETVRFLAKCVQCCRLSVLLLGTDCQCNLEVVKMLIIMLHRQWLKIRRSEDNFCVSKKHVVQFLRDTVLLLHSLSQKDKLFHEHCLEVLHQYGHAMPGVRTILKNTPNLKACEELALDELYPPEPETDDQEMDCS